MNFADLAAVSHVEGERQAALLLHAMDAADRTWLLQQLAPDHRQRLAALLDDLVALGIPADPGLLARASDTLRPAASLAAATVVPDRDFLMQLNEAGVAALAHALRAEPPRLVVRCLQCGPWPWRQSLLSRLPALQRRRVEDALRDASGAVPQATSALVRSLMRSMRLRCERAAGVPEPLAAPSESTWVERSRRFLDSLARRIRP
jgi:hypothetical protein